MENYSVLMSVYFKENSQYLKEAVQSMLEQTVRTNDFVLVCDGKLTPELDRVIEEFQNNYQEIFHVVRLEKNQGLGNALNIGLKECKNELVARMDSDDISLKERCERQLKLFDELKNLDICSGTIAEFCGSPKQITGIRKLPCSHAELEKYAKRRNPMNHMAVMYRKKAVMAAGNYQEIKYAEDYYLWARMLMNGSLFANLDTVLVYARTDNGMILRRGGLNYVKSIYKLQTCFKNMKFITGKEFLENCLIRCGVALVPAGVRAEIYKKKLRKI